MKTPLIETAMTLLLASHLWAMNLSASAPLFGALALALGRRTDCEPLLRQARRLGWLGLGNLLLGALLGLGLAGAMWLGRDRGLFEVLPQFTYKISWAVAELAFYVVCMSAYLALLAGRASIGRGRFAAVLVLTLLAATNLLYHFPPLFGVMALASHRPGVLTGPVGPSEFRRLMMLGPTLALTAHFALASLAVGGVSWLRHLVGSASAPDDTTSPRAVALHTAARSAAGVALAATAAQLLVGTWVLVELDPSSQNRLLGGDLIGTASFGISVFAAFWLMHHLAHATFHVASFREAQRTLLWLALIVALMTLSLRRAESPQRAESTGTPPYLASARCLPSSSTIRTTLSWPPKATCFPSRSTVAT